MANIFDVQGFGALSEWNGQVSSVAAGQAYQTIASLGSNSVELTDRIWTQTGTSNVVIADPNKSESDASLLAGFKSAEAAGLSVVFRAAVSPLDGTATSSMAPTDVAAFFSSYTAEIVHLATIAQEGGVTTFAIGNEMSSLSGPQYESYWTDLISQVRQVYHGQLTYSAATDEASHVSFWGQLDTIGVNTYPPLTSSETPTVQDLVNAWNQVPFNPYYAAAFNYQSPVDFLHSLAEQYGKPVLMTEVGYLSVDGTAINPGSPSSTTPDPAAQADAYNAFFQVWSAEGGSWLQGVELWQWDLDNVFNSTGYSVMGKPAEAIVSQYFHGMGTVPGLTITGSSIADTIDLGQGNNVINTGLGNDVISGGNGNDTIVAGPESAANLATTTITLSGYGSVVDGVGAEAQILVNGKIVSGLLEFTAATDPSGYQTYTITFDNSGPITSLDISLANSTPGRALHLKTISVNGVELTPSEGTNASSPGTFDLYVHTIHFDTTNDQAWFYGASTDNDLVHGGAGNDVITGGTGTDYIDGGAGTDTAVYAGDLSDYTISVVGSQVIVTDKVAGRDGTDFLSNIELLKFADTTISTASLAPAHTDVSAAGLLQVEAADSQSINSDGSINSVEYDSGGHIIQFATRYTDGSFDQLAFDTSGNETGETIRHADGSRDIYTYDIAGQDYTSQHVVTDASGHSTLIEQYHSNGTLALKQTVDASGVKTLDQYDGSGHLAEATVIQQDGSYVQSDYTQGGTLTDQTLRHADGSRDIYDYGIVGKDYTSQHVVEDASGHSTLIEQYRSDDTLALEQTVDASGVKTLDQYDGSGDIVEQTVSQKDGSYVQSEYAPDGSLAKETTRQVDGTTDVDTYDIAGQAYSARHDLIDPSGHTLATTFDNNDGSHTMTAHASGVTLTATIGNDFMNGAGGDTFVFKQTSGHDVINNFKAGDAAGHDVLEIASTLAASLADLSTHIVGHNTVIELGHDASITLTGVVTPLTPHDVLIV
jgi:glycosyl hydrolase family 113/hemolysin type calcium-binding protein